MRAEIDEAVLELARDTRERLGSIWAERARSELGAGSGFAQVVVGLYSVGAPVEVIALASAAASQEVEHAIACRELAELYLGRSVEMPSAKKVGMPPHRGATDALRAALHVVGLSCFNETIAAEFVARCLDCSEAPSVRAATSKHLRDEIGHARVGWAFLGTLDASDRAALSKWMPRLVRANGCAWLERVRLLPAEGVAGHGYPPVAELEAAVRRAMRAVVVRGLGEAGLETRAAAREAAAL